MRRYLSQEGKTIMDELPADQKIIVTNDIVRILCNSVESVLSSKTGNAISISPMVKEIEKTCLKPDIGCFVLFGGDFSGLIIINFTKEAAMEIYRNYMIGMSMPEDELARNHTSDEVANSLGELLNQCVGRFRLDLERITGIFVSHNQPKMLVVNESVQIAIETGIEKLALRQVSFKTVSGNRFYLEVALGKIKFYSLFDFQKTEVANIEEMLDQERNRPSEPM